MTESFKCPSCSAPLEFEGKPMQKCKFCGSNVIVPSGVIQSSAVFGRVGSSDFSDLSALTGKALKIGEIQKLLQAGAKIQAIKIFRETFGTGLKEAKDAVEAIERGESVDISGMQIQTADTSANFRSTAQNLAAVKKIGYTIGGSILGTVAITLILVVGAIIAVFYLVSRTVNKAIDKSFITKPTGIPPATKSKARETSIAQELSKFGGEGTGAGKFKDNRTIAVDRDGKIYSADFSGGRIQVFGANGDFQTQIMADPTRTVDALATDRQGTLFVLQGDDVIRFNKESGESLGKYRVDSASDLAIGLDGKIYVSNRHGVISVFSADGAKLKSIQIAKDLNLTDIEKIAVDGVGNFFLLDGKNYSVFKLSPEGKLLTRFGGRSSESIDRVSKSTFYGKPRDLAIDSQGRIYVSQVLRISVFDSNGNFLNDFRTTQAFGMALNDKDELFVASRPFIVRYSLNF